MEILEAIYQRRAIRAFTSESVDQQIIESLIDAAIHAPNAMDKQRWAFVVVRDKALLARMSDDAKALTLKVLGSDPRFAEFREVLSSPELNIFYDAPALIVICGTEEDRFVEQDCCLAAQNIMLAAYAKGVGTCWIGSAEAWLNQPEAKKALGIPAAFKPIAPIVLGYPHNQPKAPPRRPPHVIWIGS